MKITEKGQVTIPKPIRERYGLHPGMEIRFIELAHRVVVEKAPPDDPWRRYRGFLRVSLTIRREGGILMPFNPNAEDGSTSNTRDDYPAVSAA